MRKDIVLNENKAADITETLVRVIKKRSTKGGMQSTKVNNGEKYLKLGSIYPRFVDQEIKQGL